MNKNVKRKSRALNAFIASLFALIMTLSFTACDTSEPEGHSSLSAADESSLVAEEYEGDPYVEVNENEPTFTEEELDEAEESYETYENLDSEGRCTEAIASVSDETDPTEDEERGDISDVHPTGWHSEQGWERLHLIAWCLSAENDNEKNLVTGTHYCNIEGMLPFETKIMDYIRSTDNHVLYRVQPIFKDDEQVCRGVHMEAESVEDGGVAISFNVYCFNVQPGKTIDYENGYVSDSSSASGDSGKSSSSDNSSASGQSTDSSAVQEYVLNTNSMKFHKPDCSGAKRTLEKNKKTVKDTRENLINEGYEPCGSCNP